MKRKISTAINRVDGPAKISGEALYSADLSFDNQLYAYTVRSTIAYGKILSINKPDLPQGYFYVDKDDIPAVNRMRTVVSDNPIFAENKVYYIGQPILLIVGPDRTRLHELIKKVQIKYEKMKPVLTLEEAETIKPYFDDYHYKKGNPDEIFDSCDKVYEEEFTTGYQEHIYLEPQGIIAELKDGKISIYGSMQCPFYVKGALKDVLGWDSDKIRIVHATTGGAFGGKEEFPSMIACQVAVASLKSGRPVKMIFDRDEDVVSTTKRHPSKTIIKAALNRDQEITALEIDVKFNAGAFSGISPVVLQRGIFSATNVYNFKNIKVRGRNFKTNTVPCGAFRGFGAPQTIFAMEMFMFNMAKKLGIDPLVFKMKHLIKQGDSTATNGKMHGKVKIPEMIDSVIKKTNYSDKIKKMKKYSGVGMSIFLHGCGFTGRGENDIKGKIILKKNKDKVTLKVSSTEMGQGAETALRKIVAHTLDISIGDVLYHKVDTSGVPDSGPTVASRTTMIVGGLLHDAALEMKKRWNETNFEISRVYSHPQYLKWDDDNFQGDAYPIYSYGVNVAEVDVDPVTYEISVKKFYAVYDVGTVIDKRALRGQMQGGIVQGIGWATTEVMNSKNAKLVQNNMTDYKIPTSLDVPEIYCDFIENPYEFGPFGAKCAGEIPLTGPPPAIAAAVSNALNISINRIPVTPEFLTEVIKNEN